MAAVLEAVLVERVLVFFSADVGYDKVVCFVRSLVADASLANVDRGWFGTITWVIPVLQSGSHVVLLAFHGKFSESEWNKGILIWQNKNDYGLSKA